MRGGKTAFVAAIGLLGEVAVLQLSVCFDGDIRGGKDEVEAVGAVVGSEVEVIHRAIFGANDGSLRVAVRVLAIQPGVSRFRSVNAEVSDDEARQTLCIDFADGFADTCGRGSCCGVIGREADIENIE